jgi:tetratricopeptide (TPR) repeat protein
MSLDATIGPYHLEAEIGRGGMARVFSARHGVDGTPVALKILLPRVAKQAQFAEAFGLEVRAAARLDHPRVTAIYDHGVVDPELPGDKLLLAGSPWLAMELVSGGSISSLCGQVSWNQLRAIMLDVLDALAHAHARGMVHRDIKPANILMDYETGRVKVTDFGLVHSTGGEGSTGLGLGDRVAGTPSYMAPEQIEAAWRDFGPWTDLYALGSMAWALAVGAPPYAGELTATFARHLHGVLPAFEPVRAMPAGLGDWIAGLMMRAPERRFGRAADAAFALKGIEGVVGGRGADGQARPQDAVLEKVLFSLETVVLDPEEPTVVHAAMVEPVGPASSPGLSVAEIRAPMPQDWRSPRFPRRHLHCAGLALFGQRAMGLVGREAERQTLWETLHAVVRDRHPRLVVFEGPEGCGKSALARWLGERAEELGAARLLTASHSEVGGAAEGLGPMLNQHLRLQSLDREAAVERVGKLLARLGVADREEAVALTELARPTAEGAVQDTGLGVRFSGPAERNALLARYLSAVARERPLVLWLDDVIYSSDALGFAAELLQHDGHAPIVIVATVAGDVRAAKPEAAASLSALCASEWAIQIDLQPLDREEQSALVRELLGLEPEVAAQVEARSAGNPMFAVQLVGDWIQRGLLVAGDHGFRLAEGADVRLPSSLLEIWNERLAQLLEGRTVEQVSALELAALLGQDVDETEWAHVCKVAGFSVPVFLMNDLFRQNLAVPRDERGGWSFVHGMLCEAIVEHAARHGRKRWWASICADVLVGRPRLVARRARLLLDAGRVEEAPRILQQAIMLQLRHGENARARALIALRNQATAMIKGPQSDHLALVTDALDLMLFHDSGGLDQVAERALVLVASARGSEDPETIGMILNMSSKIMIGAGKMDLARAQLEEAAEAVHKAGLMDRYAMYCNGLSLVCMRLGDLNGAQQAARKAIAAAEDVGDANTAGRGYTMLANWNLQVGDREQAGVCIYEARRRYEESGSRSGLATAWNTTGDLRRAMGDLEGAEQAYRESADRYDACGAGSGIFSHANRGLAMAEAGKHEEALELWQWITDKIAGGGRKSLATALSVFRLAPLGALGRWSALERELDQVEPALLQTGMVDRDIGRFATQAARTCEDAGQTQLAKRSWAIALTQWTALHDDAEAEEARSRLSRS